MTVVLKLKKEMDFKFRLTFDREFMFSSIVIPHHQILYFASQRALPVRRFNIQDLVDKVSMINYLHSVQERLMKVPPVITMFWLFVKKPEPEFCSC